MKQFDYLAVIQKLSTITAVFWFKYTFEQSLLIFKGKEFTSLTDNTEYFPV